jgi:hypothetical protein
MLKSRFPVARPLALCVWLGSIAAIGFWGCQGPDTFLRKPAGGGGSGGTSFGSGGHVGSGGTNGLGGTNGSGGKLGSGGSPGTGGSVGTGGSFGLGGNGGGGRIGAGGTNGSGGTIADAGMGGTFTVFDGSVDSEAGAAARGVCNNFCSPTAIVEMFTVTQGMGFHSPQTITAEEWCFATTPGSVASGANCSSFTVSGFTGRTLTVNGVAEPNCQMGNFTPPPAVNGGWCFQISAGTPTFAAIAVF